MHLVAPREIYFRNRNVNEMRTNLSHGPARKYASFVSRQRATSPSLRKLR